MTVILFYLWIEGQKTSLTPPIRVFSRTGVSGPPRPQSVGPHHLEQGWYPHLGEKRRPPQFGSISATALLRGAAGEMAFLVVRRGKGGFTWTLKGG